MQVTIKWQNDLQCGGGLERKSQDAENTFVVGVSNASCDKIAKWLTNVVGDRIIAL